MKSNLEIRDIRATTDAQAFLQASCAQLDKAQHKIRHCLDQLSDAQVWQRPSPEMNSIANLLLHLGGNLKQWIVSSTTGAPDLRYRPAEFSDRSMKPKNELISDFEKCITECHEALNRVDPKSLLKVRRVQGSDLQLLPAIFDSLAHLQGHVQEIIHMTRSMLGPKYQFNFVPNPSEQGTPRP